MKARDRRDDANLLTLEAGERAVEDQIARVAMVLRATDGGADVVKQRGVFEKLSVDAIELMHLLRLVENLEREPRDLTAVRRLGIECRYEREDRLPASRCQRPTASDPLGRGFSR